MIFLGNNNVVEVSMTILAWCAIGLIAYRLYYKQSIKPKVWKVLVVLFIGLFSFSWTFNLFGSMIQFPLLPLGVWMLYAYFRKKDEKWQVYRPFAWFGFLANFIFLMCTLLTIPVFQILYPSHEPETYLSNLDQASIIPIHPSAAIKEVNKKDFLASIRDFSEESVHSMDWYYAADMGDDSTQTQERFPYQLIGATPKWGSGLVSVVYIEEDGKGLLLSTAKEQLYFRFDDALIEGGK